ncbi:hypothetical protein CAter10_2413 [Collimonas arenae]|nr:hypothetical protein CAter10_2413 [Collimonas arenae]
MAAALALLPTAMEVTPLAVAVEPELPAMAIAWTPVALPPPALYCA